MAQKVSASYAFLREIPERGRLFQAPISTTFCWRIFRKSTGIGSQLAGAHFR